MKEFKATHLYFSNKILEFNEINAPDWLTCKDTVRGSTMDNRWFWKNYVLALEVNESINTTFWKIERTN
jgi:hypothetical protein